MAATTQKLYDQDANELLTELLQQDLELPPPGTTMPVAPPSPLRYSLKDDVEDLLRGLAINSGRQLFVAFFVFAVTFLSVQIYSSIPRIPKDTTILFLTTISQSFATLLGLLIAVLLFNIQSIDQKRGDIYNQIKDHAEEIMNIFSDRPIEGSHIDRPMLEIIDWLSDATMNTYMSNNTYQRFWRVIVVRLSNDWRTLRIKATNESNIYYRQILTHVSTVDNLLRRAQTILATQKLIYISMQTMVKLSLLLIVSLALMVVFGADPSDDYLQSLRWPAVISTTVWTILVLWSLIYQIRDVYDE